MYHFKLNNCVIFLNVFNTYYFIYTAHEIIYNFVACIQHSSVIKAKCHVQYKMLVDN